MPSIIRQGGMQRHCIMRDSVTVRPEKAGVFSGSQPRRGKSQSTAIAWPVDSAKAQDWFAFLSTRYGTFTALVGATGSAFPLWNSKILPTT